MANPYCIYIVLDDRYAQLLKIPELFDKVMGNEKIVTCYNLDQFNSAYDLSKIKKTLNIGILK